LTGGWFRPVQLHFAVGGAALYAVVTLVVVGILMYRAYDTARSLSDQALIVRAADLVRFVSIGSNGVPHLDLPKTLSAIYASPSATEIFAIRDAGGRIVSASSPRFGELAAGWPSPSSEPSHFHIRDLNAEPDGYYGLSISLQSAVGPLSISVARPGGADAFVYSLLRKFIHDIIWAVSFLVLAALVIAIFAIRSGLKSVRGCSDLAAPLGPHATPVRLPYHDL